MARSPSLPLSEYGELSSPDPLASSQHRADYRYATRSPLPVKQPFSSPLKHQRIGPSTSATPPRTSHNHWMNAASPSKTVTEQTLSPWKIRVTVETEPEDMNAHAGRVSSRTIMVPLRDASSPSQEGARTTRGRGSQSGTTKSRRSATPVRKNSRSRSRRQSVTDLDITVLGDEGDSNDWTKQRSPRKRRSTPTRKTPLKADREDVAEGQQMTGGKATTRIKKSTQPVEIREDTDSEEDIAVDDGMESDSPELRSIDLNRVAVRPRSMSTRQRPTNLLGQDSRLTEEEADEDKSEFGNDPKRGSAISTSYPTPDPSEQEDQELNEPIPPLPDNHEGFDTILESEGFTMIDLESIPSARQFFSSPLEAQGTLQVPESTRREVNDRNPAALQPTPSAIQPSKPIPRALPSYLTLPEGESDISSNVPSSPPVLSQPSIAQPSKSAIPRREITPQVYSSPKLPSPPKVVKPDKKQDNAQTCKSTPPSLAKVVRAGIALQGVLSPKQKEIAQRTPGGSSMERLDNLFDGFDSGTRRELRAGLRLGEELAKRQRSSPDVKELEVGEFKPERAVYQGHCDTSSAQHPMTGTQVWRGETVVQHTPVQPNVNKGMAKGFSKVELTNRKNRTEQSLPKKRSSLSRETRFSSSTPPSKTTDTELQLVVDSRKRREHQWQREREAVSKEIENAGSSEVVVIDSDNEDETTTNNDPNQPQGLEQDIQDDLDIWCEEAASCDQRSSKAAVRPVRATEVDVSPELDGKLQQHNAKKPRRSVIPSPWREGGDAATESSYLTTGDMTGLFYHEPKSKIKFGAAEIERQKRQFSSGSFDVNRMAGTPCKDLAVDSQVSGAEAESPETLHSDARQLQSELSFNQSHVDTTAAHCEPSSPETLTQHSFAIEAQVERFETASEYTNEDASISLPPQPVKVPVNFNDSTVSDMAPCLPRSSPSTVPESSRPSTPRSALKGARLSLGLEDINLPAVRKVVFSTHEFRVDMDGREEQLTMHSVSSSPEAVQYDNTKEKSPRPTTERTANSPRQKSGLLGWFWSGNKKSSDAPSPTKGANDQESRPHRKQTSTSRNSSTSRGTTTQVRTPSYLLPPSYPSDPTRDTQIPVSTSGDFTNTHFRTLHIIYAKSLRPRFHAPKAHEVRPSVKKLLGAAFEADESQSGLGVFEWKVDEMALRVLERFMREIEWGYPAGSEVKWEWTEKEICERLFRVIVGEEVRKEEKAALKQVVT